MRKEKKFKIFLSIQSKVPLLETNGKEINDQEKIIENLH